MDKKELRNWVRQRKKEMTEEEVCRKSALLARKLFAAPFYQKASVIYGYLSYNQEVRTLPILARALEDGKRVAVPKVYGEEMRFVYLSDLSQVVPGYRGIPEPAVDTPVARDPAALVLMPGLAFDEAGHRIGYGGGFYDRFLALEPEHPTVALCYDFQVFPALETQAHDIPVDYVLFA